MESDKGTDNEKELTSTSNSDMGKLLSTNKDEKSDSNDTLPTSSTDASTSFKSTNLVSDDPISSTSSEMDATKSKQAASEPDKSTSGFNPEKELLEMSIDTEVSGKIEENVDDLVNDLETLLGGSSEEFQTSFKAGKASPLQQKSNKDMSEGQSIENEVSSNSDKETSVKCDAVRTAKDSEEITGTVCDRDNKKVDSEQSLTSDLGVSSINNVESMECDENNISEKDMVISDIKNIDKAVSDSERSPNGNIVSKMSTDPAEPEDENVSMEVDDVSNLQKGPKLVEEKLLTESKGDLTTGLVEKENDSSVEQEKNSSLEQLKEGSVEQEKGASIEEKDGSIGEKDSSVEQDKDGSVEEKDSSVEQDKDGSVEQEKDHSIDQEKDGSVKQEIDDEQEKGSSIEQEKDALVEQEGDSVEQEKHGSVEQATQQLTESEPLEISKNNEEQSCDKEENVETNNVIPAETASEVSKDEESKDEDNAETELKTDIAKQEEKQTHSIVENNDANINTQDIVSVEPAKLMETESADEHPIENESNIEISTQPLDETSSSNKIEEKQEDPASEENINAEAEDIQDENKINKSNQGNSSEDDSTTAENITTSTKADKQGKVESSIEAKQINEEQEIKMTKIISEVESTSKSANIIENDGSNENKLSPTEQEEMCDNPEEGTEAQDDITENEEIHHPEQAPGDFLPDHIPDTEIEAKKEIMENKQNDDISEPEKDKVADISDSALKTIENHNTIKMDIDEPKDPDTTVVDGSNNSSNIDTSVISPANTNEDDANDQYTFNIGEDGSEDDSEIVRKVLSDVSEQDKKSNKNEIKEVELGQDNSDVVIAEERDSPPDTEVDIEKVQQNAEVKKNLEQSNELKAELEMVDEVEADTEAVKPNITASASIEEVESVPDDSKPEISALENDANSSNQDVSEVKEGEASVFEEIKKTSEAGDNAEATIKNPMEAKHPEPSSSLNKNEVIDEEPIIQEPEEVKIGKIEDYGIVEVNEAQIEKEHLVEDKDDLPVITEVSDEKKEATVKNNLSIVEMLPEEVLDGNTVNEGKEKNTAIIRLDSRITDKPEVVLMDTEISEDKGNLGTNKELHEVKEDISTDKEEPSIVKQDTSEDNEVISEDKLDFSLVEELEVKDSDKIDDDELENSQLENEVQEKIPEVLISEINIRRKTVEQDLEKVVCLSEESSDSDTVPTQITFTEVETLDCMDISISKYPPLDVGQVSTSSIIDQEQLIHDVSLIEDSPPNQEETDLIQIAKEVEELENNDAIEPTSEIPSGENMPGIDEVLCQQPVPKILQGTPLSFQSDLLKSRQDDRNLTDKELRDIEATRAAVASITDSSQDTYDSYLVESSVTIENSIPEVLSDVPECENQDASSSSQSNSELFLRENNVALSNNITEIDANKDVPKAGLLKTDVSTSVVECKDDNKLEVALPSESKPDSASVESFSKITTSSENKLEISPTQSEISALNDEELKPTEKPEICALNDFKPEISKSDQSESNQDVPTISAPSENEPEIIASSEVKPNLLESCKTKEIIKEKQINEAAIVTSALENSVNKEEMKTAILEAALSVSDEDVEADTASDEKPHKTKGRKSKVSEPLSVNIETVECEKVYSPKVTIKPLKVPDDEVSTTSDADVNKGSLKMTITKQSDTLHSILKVADAEDECEVESIQEESIPKLVIKPKIQQVEQQHSPKTSRSSKVYSPTSTQRCGSPRVTIKLPPEPKADNLRKITFKPVIKPEESPKRQSPKILKEQDQKNHNPKITIKPIPKPPEQEKEETLPITPKLTIKPIKRHAEDDPEGEQERSSPKVTIKAVVRPTEESDQSNQTTPRLIIKPIKKQEDEIKEPEQGRSSPKISIKPLVKPSEPDLDDEIEEVKERIVLKINKGNLPTPVKDKKRDYSEDDKLEKLGKIKLKFSTSGGHPHIVQESDETNKKLKRDSTGIPAHKIDELSNKRPLEEKQLEKNKRVKSSPTPDKDNNIENRFVDQKLAEESKIQNAGDSFKVDKISSTPDITKITDIASRTTHIEAKTVMTVGIVTPTITPTPKKRGRPRKVPLEIRPELCDTPSNSGSPGMGLLSSSPATPDGTNSGGRPKRSCRGQNVIAALGIKPRKPRGRGRGSKVNMGDRMPLPATPVAPIQIISMKPEKEAKFNKAKLKLMHKAIEEEVKRSKELSASVSREFATKDTPGDSLNVKPKTNIQIDKDDTVIILTDDDDTSRNFEGDSFLSAGKERSTDEYKVAENLLLEGDDRIEMTDGRDLEEGTEDDEPGDSEEDKRKELVKQRKQEAIAKCRAKRMEKLAKAAEMKKKRQEQAKLQREARLAAEEAERASAEKSRFNRRYGRYGNPKPQISLIDAPILETDGTVKSHRALFQTETDLLKISQPQSITVDDDSDFSSSHQSLKPLGSSNILLPSTSSEPMAVDSEEGSLAGQSKFGQSSIATDDVDMMDEETRMSADLRGSRAHTPAKQSIIPPPESIIEDSQGSLGTTESGGGKSKSSKTPRLEVHQDLDSNTLTVDNLAEYCWNGQGPFMLQEQVAQFLGIKSFKRKYPQVSRRAVDIQERDYLKENGLASETLCDLGLTAVNAQDILDIMYTDFQEKYELYCAVQRERQAREFANKQKALSQQAQKQGYEKLDIIEQAVQSAAQWNKQFNKERKEQRRAAMDLQNLVVHYPKTKKKPLPVQRIGNYPVALVPGQFTDFYKEFTPTELNNLPLNTMCYNEIKVMTVESESEESDSGSDSDSGSSSSSSGSESECGADCKECATGAAAVNGTKEKTSTAPKQATNPVTA